MTPLRRIGASALVVCAAAAAWGLIDVPAAPPKEAGGPWSQDEVARDPYVPVPPEDRRTSPPVRVRRNGYESVQVNVDANGNNILGDAANEPSIAVDPTNPLRMAIGWRQFDTVASDFRQAGWAYTTDGGQTWTFPGAVDPGVFRSDPVLDADADGNFYFYSLDRSYDCHMFISTDGGVSWSEPIDAHGGDKPWMTIDRTGGIGNGNVYCTWGGDFIRSTDGGHTYNLPVEIPGRPRRGTVTAGPDSAVYVAGWDSGPFRCARSSNAWDPLATPEFEPVVEVELGGNLRVALGPNPGGLLGQVLVGCDHSEGSTRGNVYVLCSVDPPGDDPLDVMFARSTDGGATWTGPVRVNDDAEDNGAWQWFGTMSVAPNGRIDVVWNDTRDDPGGYDSELYYSYSTDTGLSWSPNLALTPAWDPHLGWPNQDKIGDYYDMVSDDACANLAYAATLNGEQDIYFLRIGDCNGNGVHDGADIASGTSTDANGNGVPDECEVPGDLNCDGAVNADDIDPFVLALVSAGNAEPFDDYSAAYPDCDPTLADVNADGSVNLFDIDAFINLLTG